MVTSNAATGYVAKISMLRLNIGSGMLRLSSCMLGLGLRLSIGSCMLRLGLELRLRLSFRGSGGHLKLRWMSPFETKIKTDIPKFRHVDFP